MGSSTTALNYDIMKVVNGIKPMSILDVGFGTGKFGFLFRESEMKFLATKGGFERIIDGIDIEFRYVTPVHTYVYDRCIIADIRKYELDRDYDFIFMGDIIEHMIKAEGKVLVDKLLKKCKHLMISTPYGNTESPFYNIVGDKLPYEKHLSGWYPEDFKGLDIVEWDVKLPNFYILLKGERNE